MSIFTTPDNTPMKRADVIIIGAGLMGSATALWLARARKKVLLLEKEHHPCHASAVNTGGVRRLNRAQAEIPLSVAAMELWHRLPSIVGSDTADSNRWARFASLRMTPPWLCLSSG
jgi:glycine/D-amino acid oxidase-like deaminating enzyme